MFFEVFKQQKGEYMGSILTGWLESMGRQMKPDPSTLQLNRETLDKGLSSSVRDNDERFPLEWRLSRRGRASERRDAGGRNEGARERTDIRRTQQERKSTRLNASHHV